jgi:Na+-driven multidrug efflux pump
MGLAGTALATVVAQVAGIGLNVWALLSGQSRIRLSLNDRPDFPLLGRMIKLGAPASLRGSERATSQLALLGIAAPFGDVALAAYAITRRVDMFTNFGSGGLAQATGVMVGQNLGAQQINRVKSAILWGLLYVAMMKGTIISLFWAFPHAPISIFLTDPAVLDFTVTWLRIQLFGAFFQGQMQVLQESYMAAGDTIVPLVVTLIGVWMLEVPIAWYLARNTDLGALSVAVASIPGFGVRALIFAAYYFHPRWLRMKVI